MWNWATFKTPCRKLKLSLKDKYAGGENLGKNEISFGLVLIINWVDVSPQT